MKEEQKISFLNEVISLLPECLCHSVKRFVACQFALESDFGQSPMALCNNNFCGMKVARVRISLALNLSEAGDFALFSGFYSCICDYLLWLQSNKFSRTELNSLSAFVGHLNYSGYCPEPDYIDRIFSIYNQYYSHYE